MAKLAPYVMCFVCKTCRLCLFAVIVTEKTNILLRYLHQQWDKKVSMCSSFISLIWQRPHPQLGLELRVDSIS